MPRPEARCLPSRRSPFRLCPASSPLRRRPHSPPSPSSPPVVSQSSARPASAPGGEHYKQAETTRLLCASAYLDRGFREHVLKWFHEDSRHRATAPSFGVDMATVVGHCERARRELNSRDWWMLIPAALVIVGLFTQSIGAYVIAALAAFVFCFYYLSRARSIATAHFRRGRFNPDALLEKDPASRTALREAESGNVLVYSGFTPFVGSGENIGGWSFALDLHKRADGTRAPLPDDDPIRLADLYERIGHDLGALQLDRLLVDDKLYINGRDVRDDLRFIATPLSCPHNRVSDDVVLDAMLEQREQKLRHYRCIRVVDWSGEQVLSIFLRFSRLSHNLFVEASYFLLTPVGERFRKIDSLSPEMNLERIFGTAVLAALSAPFLTVLSPVILLQRGLEHRQKSTKRRQEEKRILEDPSFDYGAAQSLRQWASPNQYRRYFQKLDKEMYLKVLEKTILGSVLRFLEEHGVDISELEQRQAMILNNGVIVSGGVMSTENLAVGEGAKIGNLKQKAASMAANAGVSK